MFFLVILAIVCIALYVIDKASKSNKKRLINKAEVIKKTYPRAFKEYESKHRINLSSAKKTTLKEIVKRPRNTWNNEEEALININQKYDEIKRQYPNGLDKLLSRNQLGMPPEELIQKENAIIRLEDEYNKEKDTYKKDHKEITKFLRDNYTVRFYHFTALDNVKSIWEMGGLYSWYTLKQKGIIIPVPGGTELSRTLDTRFGLQDYVRLSFCEDHPMAYRLIKQGKDVVLFEISIEVASLNNTLFSNMNATDSNHQHGGKLADLEKVDFLATHKSYVSRESPYFKTHQAEVLVKSFIPAKYICNFESPEVIS